MPPAGFGRAIPASGWRQTHALDLLVLIAQQCNKLSNEKATV